MFKKKYIVRETSSCVDYLCCDDVLEDCYINSFDNPKVWDFKYQAELAIKTFFENNIDKQSYSFEIITTYVYDKNKPRKTNNLIWVKK